MLLSALAFASAADRIILRNLELIADRTVVAVDEDGARLDAPRAGGSDRLTWDEIERGRVSAELQADFDRLKSELGPPLYKVRQRLRIGDYAGLLEPAEKLYPQFAARQSQTAYLVCQALMWGRLALGQREQAVEPLLKCVWLIESGTADPQHLPGTRRLVFDASGCICADLPPIWLRPQAAKDLLPEIEQLVKELPMPRPSAAYLYYASLASEAGQFEEANRVLDAVDGADPPLRLARQLVRAQIEIQQKLPGGATSGLAQVTDSSLAGNLARYWQGRHLLNSSDVDLQRDGLLALLSIPAGDQTQQSELAAAALHDSAAALDRQGDSAGAAAVRRELTARYAATAVGVQSLSGAK